MVDNLSYAAVMGRSAAIMKKAVGIDYDKFRITPLAFNYEKMMGEVGYNIDEIQNIQHETGVGRTPLLELHNINMLVRKLAPKGKGARIFVKDEAVNPSGSFKDRRASISVYVAKQKGFPGVIAATSGNYGAAVASQTAMRGLKCIVVQEVFDSRGMGQPEIIEKSRKCEAFGAEVHQLSVGPELFYYFLLLLEETGFFSASLYTPYAIAGIETLGLELITQMREQEGVSPSAVVIAHAGGGNITGTARGILKAKSPETQIIAASVDLAGLHMASDRDFNRKSFTTAHTGFGIPFATWTDRTDVPLNAARPLRYIDRLLTVKQGAVFYMTEMLAQLEGLERGPAGNTSLAAAFAIAQQMNQDEIVVVQETEYTGAGKHPWAQLNFAVKNGIEIKYGDPAEEVAGKTIVIPEHPCQIQVSEVSLENVRRSYLRRAISLLLDKHITKEDLTYMIAETKSSEAFVTQILRESGITKIPIKA
jgi:cysteine synthase